uniref:E1 ubiquitin-activating enzyme n=1 Tax=Syphacia muris TaxID=451379 RepID=A0A158R3T7_9BILA
MIVFFYICNLIFVRYALGESAMRHLRTASILISGIGSVGAEIAKNLILGGVRRVTIHDTRTTTWRDLSAQFYLREDDIGKNRAAASFQRLSELNDSVTCTLSTDPLTEKFVKSFEVVILTDTPLQKQLEINKWTREADKRLLVADARGLFAYLFTDFGSNFRVDDASGEPCKEVLIEYVDRETGDVVCLDNAMHGFEDGDYVTFSEVKGMTELNGIDPIKITVKKSHVFNIDKAAANFSQYTEGGRAKQVKMPSYIKFKSLSESLTDPDLLIWDFAKFDNPQQLHLLWQALYKFEEEYGRSPAPRSDSDVELMKEVLKSLDKSGNVSIAPTLIKQFSYQASGNLVPLSSIVGGIGAQEAMKAITHHMTPLKQLLYIDCIEALPGHWSLFDNDKLTPEDCKQENSRYGGQIAVFGKAYQEALANQKFFIVGAGAIGCEILKNLAMMGIACGNGKLKITDMDQIEISNLNRQFLFRRKDVGSRKSEVAAKAVKGFNPKLNIVALAERVGPETEGIFNDSFFSELNGILNALDNLDARRYMDRRCIYYRLPLLESGTMGSKGNVQVVYPYLTESYGSSVDPPEKDIPICTLKNFPNEIQHTIQWARDLFEGMFTVPAETVNQFLDDERAFLGRLDSMNMGQKIQLLGQIKRSLIDDKPNSAEDCIIWARKLFQENYHDTIAQLLYTFPPNQVTDMGAKFWSGTKRCPHVLNFNPEMEEHFNFVYAGSILKAQQYNIQPILDKNRILLILNEPKKGLKIAVSDAEAKEQAEMHDDADEQLANLKLKLAKLNTKSVQRLVPIDFEKDDDTNHHMEFITAASNLRAENYDIPPADRLKTKQIAGRIIPAIATTTAAIAGLVMIELYKMIGDGVSLPQVPIERFKNGFMNLSLPLFVFAKYSFVISLINRTKDLECCSRYSDKTFTLWDRIEIQGPKTLKELMDYIQEKTKLDISMLSSGVSLIYSFFMNASKRASRLNQDVKKVVEEVSRRPIPDYARSIVLEVMTTNENDEDVEIPYIKYNF